MVARVDTYRSPDRNLVRFFSRSRDQWKEKCLAAKQQIKFFKTKVADLQLSRQHWKELAKHRRTEIVRLRNQIAALKSVADD